MTNRLGHNAARRVAAVSVAAVLLVVLGIGSALGAALQAAPPAPVGVTASAGTTGTVGIVGWHPPARDVEVAGYRVWRAESDGPFVPVAAVPGAATEYRDVHGLPGEGYRYGVTAMDAAGRESDIAVADSVVTARWSLSPHMRANAETVGSSDACGACHQPHDADGVEPLLRDGAAPAGQSAVCYRCHGGTTTGANVRSGADSFSSMSGHAIEAVAVGADPTNECGSCHDLHASSQSDPMLRPATLATAAGARPVPGPVAWCLACHDGAGTWYSEKYDSAYPAVGTGPRDADGYPVWGTWPGPAVYTDPARSPHVRIPASASLGRAAGDCLYCHAAHRGANRYDGLRDQYRPTSAGTLAEDLSSGSYAAACFACHGGSTPAGLDAPATDIRRHVLSDSPNAGHRVRTSGGVLPQRAPLPCYDCHDPHGTAGSEHALLVVTQTGPGTSVVLGDAPGEISMGAQAAPADVRAFCFTCHTTSDTAAGWDGSAMRVVASGALVEGIDRVSATASLRLRANKAHEQADARSCYDCHGSDYSAAGSSNVHAPSIGALPRAAEDPAASGLEATAVAPPAE